MTETQTDVYREVFYILQKLKRNRAISHTDILLLKRTEINKEMRMLGCKHRLDAYLKIKRRKTEEGRLDCMEFVIHFTDGNFSSSFFFFRSSSLKFISFALRFFYVFFNT